MGYLNMNAVILEDIRTVLSNNKDFRLLSGKSVFITGATGLIGSFTIKLLIEASNTLPAPIRIFALARNPEKIIDVFGKEYADKLTVVTGDILALPEIKFPIDYFIHGASVTSSYEFIKHPVKTINTVVNGTQNVLALARKQKAKAFVFLSSMEVYGFLQKSDSVHESEYGYIDLLDARSSYSESKRLAECLCAAYSNEFAFPVKIARLTQTFGPGMNYNDTRVAGQFARAVLEGKDIVLETDGSTARNSVYVADAVSAIISILLKGEPGQAYNVADKNSFYSIKETAIMVANKIDKGRIAVRCRNEINSMYAHNNSLSLNLCTKRVEDLGWRPLFSLEESYRRLIVSLRSDHSIRD